MPLTSIKNVMTTQLWTVPVDATMSQVAQIFTTKNIHHIPVVDGECLCGIISSLDFERIKHGMTLFRNPDIEAYNQALYESTMVKNVMTKDVQCIRASDDLDTAYRLFKQNKYHALPVIEQGRLVGILTPIDLISYFMTKSN